MMRGFVLLAVGLAFVLWWLVPKSHEPIYKGTRLSGWVISFRRAATGMAPAEDQKEAILHIGTNALPFLVRWLTYPPPRRLQIFGTPIGSPFGETKGELARGSLLALEVMGPSAAPALPELILLVRQTNQVVLYRVMDALDTVRRNLGTNTALVVPRLMELLNSPEPDVAGIAAIELGYIGKSTQTDAIVGVLTRLTESADKHLRYCSVCGLGELGPLARSAVTAVVRVLGDPDILVRRTATNSLRRIAPEILGGDEEEHGF